MEKNIIHIFICALQKEAFRKEVREQVQSLTILPPYDIVIEQMLKLDGNIEKSDVINLARLHLSTLDVQKIQQIEEVSDGVAIAILEELQDSSTLEDVLHLLTGSATPKEKLSNIAHAIESGHKALQEPRAKRVGELEVDTEEALLHFLNYPLYRNKLAMISAYPGIGKTTISLALAKLGQAEGLNVLYFCIGDWDEPSLGRKLVDTELDIYVALYERATLYELELELESVQPDLVIVDSLTNLTSHHVRGDDKFYMELGQRAKHLREVANKYNTCMVVTHQLKTLREIVIEDDLMSSKAHLLAELDLGLGVGGLKEEAVRNVSTLKARAFPALPVFRIEIDFERLHIYYI